MEYNYKEDTLLHSVGFNLQRFVSVLNHGIISKNKAQKLGISYSKNYLVRGQNDDYISMLKVGKIDLEKDISSYNLHTTFGINFIVEDVIYEDDSNKYFIHHQDEVIVKDKIDKEHIKGIAIPNEFQNIHLNKLTIIPPDITNYSFIKNVAANYYTFLNYYNYELNKDIFIKLLNELLFINLDYSSTKELNEQNLELERIKEEFKCKLRELNEFFSKATQECFSNLLGYNPTLSEIICYLSNNKHEIYNIPFDKIYYKNR